MARADLGVCEASLVHLGVLELVRVEVESA